MDIMHWRVGHVTALAGITSFTPTLNIEFSRKKRFFFGGGEGGAGAAAHSLNVGVGLGLRAWSLRVGLIFV